MKIFREPGDAVCGSVPPSGEYRIETGYSRRLKSLYEVCTAVANQVNPSRHFQNIQLNDT